MSSLLLLPHFLLALTVLGEHHALWLIFFSVIPMLDTVFFVSVPCADQLLSNAWPQLCAWSWPICLFSAACRAAPTWQSMLSFGIMHNTALCLADELDLVGRCHDKALARVIRDFMGLFRSDSPVSVLRALSVFVLMALDGKLLWHTGTVGIGFLLHDYVSWVDEEDHKHHALDHYGLSHYAMFKYFHGKLLPAPYMWLFFFPETGLKDCAAEEKDQDGIRFDGVPEGPPGARGEAADAPPADE